ncbi:hypothetical protein ACP3S7_01750 [Phytobacter ursingii]
MKRLIRATFRRPGKRQRHRGFPACGYALSGLPSVAPVSVSATGVSPDADTPARTTSDQKYR